MAPFEHTTRKSAENLVELVEEYEDISERFGGMTAPDEDEIAKLLHADHEWTDAGAAELVQLATEYGWFFLREACAVAMALGMEDGEKCF